MKMKSQLELLKNDKIISRNHNQKEKLKCATKHAEILAIEEASLKFDSWRLNDCEMYLTMEPCIMCCGALIQSRISKIYYLVDNYKFGGISNVQNILENSKYNHEVKFEKIYDYELEKKMKIILNKFFLDKR